MPPKIPFSIKPNAFGISGIEISPYEVESLTPSRITIKSNIKKFDPVIGGWQLAVFIKNLKEQNLLDENIYNKILSDYPGLNEKYRDTINVIIDGKIFHPFNFDEFNGHIGDQLNQYNTIHVEQGQYAIIDKNSEKNILETSWCDNCVGLLIWCEETGMAMLTHVGPLELGIETIIAESYKIISDNNKNNKVHAFIVTNNLTEQNARLKKIVRLASDKNKYVTCEVVCSSRIAFDGDTGIISIFDEEKDLKITRETSYANMMSVGETRCNFSIVPYLYPHPGTEKLNMEENFAKDFCNLKLEARWERVRKHINAPQNAIKLVVQNLSGILEHMQEHDKKALAALTNFFKALNTEEQIILLAEIQKNIATSSVLKEPNNNWIKIAQDGSLDALFRTLPTNYMALELLKTIETQPLLAEAFGKENVDFYRRMFVNKINLQKKSNTSYISIFSSIKITNPEKLLPPKPVPQENQKTTVLHFVPQIFTKPKHSQTKVFEPSPLEISSPQ